VMTRPRADMPYARHATAHTANAWGSNFVTAAASYAFKPLRTVKMDAGLLQNDLL
jgi:hypothetical protein